MASESGVDISEDAIVSKPLVKSQFPVFPKFRGTGKYASTSEGTSFCARRGDDSALLKSPEDYTVSSLEAEGTLFAYDSMPYQPEVQNKVPPELVPIPKTRRLHRSVTPSPVHQDEPDAPDAPTPRSSYHAPSTGKIGAQSLNDGGSQHFPMASFDPLSTRVEPSMQRSISPQPLPSELMRPCVAPEASAVNFEAAEFPIQPEQGAGPLSSQSPSSSPQIDIGNMEQESAASQKVLNDTTTPEYCDVNDDAGSRDKAKGKRKASGRTDEDPGKGRPPKRVRSDRVTARQHEDFYILDANTVIEIDGVLFKLHRSRLVAKSLFFAQLLEHHDNYNLPNDRLMVYHLGNTTVDDFVALLKFDDNPIEYYFEPPPFSVLAPILRAATALRFETYRAWAARTLKQMWSSSLADLTSKRKESAVEVIVLARSCGVNSGVKRALYELARTRRIGLHDNDVFGQSGLEQIGRADERCVELMRELLVTTWSEVAVRIDTSVCKNDKKKGSYDASSKRCPLKTTQQATWDIHIHNSGLYTKFLFDPVCGIQALINIPWEEEHWCSDCIQSRRATCTKTRRDLWNKMDKWIAE
ncbi:hypothetical protein DFH29DRAFT_918810 [Suillus ampliporus]|nr:hypothetical protein DFH29DRAFT_918810 [Suillus ampliporus]